MSIQLDTATVIALIAESVFFGIFTVLFSISMFILVLRRRQSHRMNKPIITVSVLMYLLGLAHFCIASQRMMIAFLQYREEPGGPSTYLSISADPLYLTKIGIYTAQTVIGDSFMAYRLYIVWCRDKCLLLAVSILLIASLVCGVVAATDAGLVGPTTLIFIPRLKHWILSFFCLTLFTNLTCSILIAYRIWSIENRLNDTIAERRRSPVLPVIIESSMLYSVSLISLTGLFASGSWAQYIVLDSIVQLIGIVFTLIIVRIGLGLSHGAVSSSTQGGRFTSQPGQFSLSRGSQAPMHPLIVRIEESRVTDGMPVKADSIRESQED